MSPERVTESDVEQAPRARGVLVVAAHYPPSTAAAAIRARNIVHNLQALGHQVRVVTTRIHASGETPPEARALRFFNVETFARSVVRRDQGGEGQPTAPRTWQRGLRSLAARLLIPDLYAPWIPVAAVVARREGKAGDLVFSTGGASAHVVARLIRAKRPTIVDVNDLWWRNSVHSIHRHGPIRDHVNRFLERTIIRGATEIVVPVDEQGFEVERRWDRTCSTIFTGFDASEFAPPLNASHPSRREIVFAGTMYGDFRLDTLLDALALGRSEHGWTPEDLRVCFFGTGSGTALDAARSHGVSEFVDGAPPIPRPALIQRLIAADALVLPLYDDDPYHLPMRFFEFVGAGRPMIGIGSASAPAARLITAHRLGYVCTDTGSLVSTLRKIVTTPRLADLPAVSRARFDAVTVRPALQRLLEQTTRAAEERQVSRS